jgi:hypothetical protein
MLNDYHMKGETFNWFSTWEWKDKMHHEKHHLRYSWLIVGTNVEWVSHEEFIF